MAGLCWAVQKQTASEGGNHNKGDEERRCSWEKSEDYWIDTVPLENHYYSQCCSVSLKLWLGSGMGGRALLLVFTGPPSQTKSSVLRTKKIEMQRCKWGENKCHLRLGNCLSRNLQQHRWDVSPGCVKSILTSPREEASGAAGTRPTTLLRLQNHL